MQPKIPVRFLRAHQNYRKNDVAGFDEDRVEAMEAAEPPICKRLTKAEAAKLNAAKPSTLELPRPSSQEQARALALDDRAADLDARDAALKQAEAANAEKQEALTKREGELEAWQEDLRDREDELATALAEAGQEAKGDGEFEPETPAEGGEGGEGDAPAADAKTETGDGAPPAQGGGTKPAKAK